MEKYSNIPALTRNQFRDTMFVLINAELADSICGVIDGMMVGRFLGEDAMAAHGIASPIFLILTIFSYIVTVGFQQPCTVAIGQGKTQRANGMYSFTMLFTLICSLLFALVGLSFPHEIACLMGAPASGHIHQMAADYLSAISWGTPSLLLFLVLIPALQLEGRRKLVIIGSLVMGVSDIVIDLLNVLVFHGGMWGIGMATTLSYTLGLLVLLSYLFYKNRFFRFRYKDISLVNVRRMLGMGLPSGIQVGTSAVATVLISTLVMGTLGATAMSSLAIQRNLQTLFISLATGISGATLLLTGISYGEQDRRGLMDVGRMSAYATLVVSGGVGLLVFLLANPLVSLYLPRMDASYSLAIHAVRWLAVALPLITWTHCVGSYLQGVERSVSAMVMYVCAELVFLVTCAYVMRWIWGAEGVFASFSVSQLLVILVFNLLAYLRRDKRYTGMEAYVFVPEDFGVAPENRLERTLCRQEEVWTLAEQAQTFCLDRGVSEDKAYKVSLYIEEMGNIIFTYGFDDGKPHHLEVRLSLNKEEIIIRFRDDCRRFDIQERASHWKEDPAHPEFTLGVRMVMAACKMLKYNNSLNFNNLMVVL